MGRQQITLQKGFYLTIQYQIHQFTSFQVGGTMKALSVVIVLPFLIAAIAADEHPCKDVTYGECNLDDDHIKVLSKTSQDTVQLCSAECYDTINCTTYRYNKQSKECTLINDVYRGYCEILGVPVGKSLRDCQAQLGNQACDSHLEEDCEYEGELLYSSPKGSVISAPLCQVECESNNDCKYWIFNTSEIKCFLKKDGKKTCAVWGGPKEPTYDHCQYVRRKHQSQKL